MGAVIAKAEVSGHRLASAIDWIADTLEPVLRDAFLEAVQGAQPSLEPVLTAIRAGGNPYDPAVEAAIQSVTMDLSQVRALQYQAYTSGVAVGANFASPTFNLRFDLTSPRTLAWTQQNAASLVKYVGVPAQQNLRNIISHGYESGWTVDQLARFIRDNHVVGLLPQHTMAVAKYRQGLMNGGMAQTLADRQTQQYADRLLNYRSWNIARTEIVAASNAGLMDYWQAAADAGFIDPATTEREWLTRLDEKECPVCRGLHLKRASLDGDFYGDTGIVIRKPPAHPSCRCSMALKFNLLPGMEMYDEALPGETAVLQNPPGAEPGWIEEAALEWAGTRAFPGATSSGVPAYVPAALSGFTSVIDVLEFLGVAGASAEIKRATVLGFLSMYADELADDLARVLGQFVGAIRKYNPYHKPKGPGGGQFDFKPGGGGTGPATTPIHSDAAKITDIDFRNAGGWMTDNGFDEWRSLKGGPAGVTPSSWMRNDVDGQLLLVKKPRLGSGEALSEVMGAQLMEHVGLLHGEVVSGLDEGGDGVIVVQHVKDRYPTSRDVATWGDGMYGNDQSQYQITDVTQRDILTMTLTDYLVENYDRHNQNAMVANIDNVTRVLPIDNSGAFRVPDHWSRDFTTFFRHGSLGGDWLNEIIRGPDMSRDVIRSTMQGVIRGARVFLSEPVQFRARGYKAREALNREVADRKVAMQARLDELVANQEAYIELLVRKTRNEKRVVARA